MALSDNPYLDLPLADVQALQSQFLLVMTDIAGGGKSYSFPGRTFTRADQSAVEETLAKLRTAIRYITRRGSNSAQAIIDTQGQFSR